METILECMFRRLACGPIFGTTSAGNPISVSYLPGTNKVRICVGYVNRNTYYSPYSKSLVRWFYRNRKNLCL